MRTHSTIVKEAAPVGEIAAGCGVSVHTVRSWIQRSSIPSAQWATFSSSGWATLDELALAAAGSAPVAPQQAA